VWTDVEDCADLDLVCEVVDVDQSELGDAMCVPGSGGTGGTGGTAGGGGSAGTGGVASSCAEVDIPDEAQLAGTLSISPTVGTFDDVMIVTVDVDADTREVTALLRNESSGVLDGSGVALTSGNETVEVDVRVETVAQPGPHTLDIELLGDPPDPLNYILYTPGDGNTYVRIKVENKVPGPETATTCLVVNANIDF
jgi:hypothetical protein